ncbi:FecR family protein [Dysgonomonas massiliensis]|uniref:FecR family protein n=1 Tax=Dysgonomonas massiliensis TaxID=2040292 RepID=UPI000C76D9FA|nr:FecR family protein [Dysgonomonas massiliensis]
MEDNIILRYLIGESTPEELELLADWIEESEENRDYLFRLESLWQKKVEIEYSADAKLDRAFATFMKNNKLNKEQDALPVKKTFRIPTWIQYGAIACITSILSLIAYNIALKQNLPNYTTVEVPRGQYSKVYLPDSTVVWINSDTKLSYSDSYMTSKNRQVKLEGEAFFDVRRDEKHPFIVQSKNINVKVLGTEFNIKAYNSDLETIVSLKSGSVEVSTDKESKEMFPGQVLRLKDNMLTVDSDAIAETAYSWINGELHFEEENFMTIVEVLERKFNVIIYIENESLKNRKLTCRIQKNTSLPKVLDILRNATDLNYEINQHEVIIN